MGVIKAKAVDIKAVDIKAVEDTKVVVAVAEAKEVFEAEGVEVEGGGGEEVVAAAMVVNRMMPNSHSSTFAGFPSRENVPTEKNAGKLRVERPFHQKSNEDKIADISFNFFIYTELCTGSNYLFFAATRMTKPSRALLCFPHRMDHIFSLPQMMRILRFDIS